VKIDDPLRRGEEAILGGRFRGAREEKMFEESGQHLFTF